MAPFDALPAGYNNSGTGNPLPFGLKLAFSEAADYSRIDALFDPAVKQSYDPQGFVCKRLEADFREAVSAGGAAFLSSETGDIITLTVAYHTHIADNPAPGALHDYTEIGTGLSRLPGFNSAQLVMTALALREWWAAPPARALVNEINNKNLPSVKTYRDYLGWEEITDQGEIDTLFDATYKNIAQDCGAGPGKPPPPDKREDESLYSFTNRAIATHARILLSFMDQGGLLNKKTGHAIPVDFSALDDAGLTRARLEALSRGITDRDQLRQDGPA